MYNVYMYKSYKVSILFSLFGVILLKVRSFYIFQCEVMLLQIK